MPVFGSISETKVNVCFEWETLRFFSFEEKLCSPEFKFLGCSWELVAYPKGYLVSGWISLYLCKKERKNENLTAVKNVTFTLGLKNAKGTVEEKEAKNQTFMRLNLTGGFRKFFSIEDIQRRKLELMPSSTLIFTCRMEDGVRYPVKPMSPPLQHIGLETLSSNFKDLLISKRNHDLIIRVHNKKFYVHKAILVARSTVFAAMFQHNMSEKKTGVITIEDCGPESFWDFLQFLYTGKIQIVSFVNACHLYVVADKYDVEDLKSPCSTYMKENLTVENLLSVISLAELYNDVYLLSEAQKIFNQNFKVITSMAWWEMLLKHDSRLANKLLKTMAETSTSFSPTEATVSREEPPMKPTNQPLTEPFKVPSNEPLRQTPKVHFKEPSISNVPKCPMSKLLAANKKKTFENRNRQVQSISAEPSSNGHLNVEISNVIKITN